MPPESSSALTIIALAVSVQTVLMIAGGIAAVIIWRRVTVETNRQMVAMNERLDEVVRETRSAAQAVTRVSDQANGLLGGTQGVFRTLAQVVAPPQALLAAGAVSAASGMLSRWLRARRRVA